MVPLALPTTVGVKVALIVQVAPAANELPQLSVSPKGALGVMPTVIGVTALFLIVKD
jgi:hypothetical protein